MTSFSSSEMLAYWRRALGFDTSRPDCDISIYEGIDVDGIIRVRMRQWYLRQLDTALPCMVNHEDVASRCSMAPSKHVADAALITLPADARRPMSVKLSGWEVPAPVVTPSEAAQRIKRMASPFGRPGCCDPLALKTEAGIEVYPARGTLQSLRAVVDPGEDLYILDEFLLETIPNSLS